MKFLKRLINVVQVFCKAPQSHVTHIPIKQMGVGNRTFHVIVHKRGIAQ